MRLPPPPRPTDPLDRLLRRLGQEANAVPVDPDVNDVRPLGARVVHAGLIEKEKGPGKGFEINRIGAGADRGRGGGCKGKQITEAVWPNLLLKPDRQLVFEDQAVHAASQFLRDHLIDLDRAAGIQIEDVAQGIDAVQLRGQVNPPQIGLHVVFIQCICPVHKRQPVADDFKGIVEVIIHGAPVGTEHGVHGRFSESLVVVVPVFPLETVANASTAKSKKELITR